MDRENVHRREFLKVTTAAAAAAATTAGALAAQDAAAPSAVTSPAIVSNRIELRVTQSWTDETSGFGDSAARLGRRIALATDGRIRMTTVAGAGQGLAAIMAGTADASHGFEHEHVAQHPVLGYFAGLPGFTSLHAHDLEAWLICGGGQELWDELAGDIGVKPLLAGHTGRWPGLWSTKAIDGLADIEGASICVQGLACEVVRGIGAHPLAVGADVGPDAIGALLASGRAMAVEWGNAQAHLTDGVTRHAKYLAPVGLTPAGAAVSLGIRRETWDRLSSSDQAAITACAAEEFRLTLAEARSHEGLLRTALTTAHGVTIAALPDDVAGAITRVSEAVIAEAAATDALSGRINASYMAFYHAMTGGGRSPPPAVSV